MTDKLELVMEPYEALPCHLRVFKINGKDADEYDFGSNYDDCPEIAEEYGCGNSCFHADPECAKKAMKKYDITLEQFNEICDKLESVLHVGMCGWCV